MSIMDRSGSFTLVHAKDHPVLDGASAWHVEDVLVSTSDTDDSGACVTLVVRQDHVRTLLRFEGVADFTLRSGRPGAPLRILDVTHLQWRGITVRVETGCGDLGFWARDVARIDEPSRAKKHPRPFDRGCLEPLV